MWNEICDCISLEATMFAKDEKDVFDAEYTERIIEVIEE